MRADTAQIHASHAMRQSMGNSAATWAAKVKLAERKSVTTEWAQSQRAEVEVCGVGGTAALIRPCCSEGKRMTATCQLYL